MKQMVNDEKRNGCSLEYGWKMPRRVNVFMKKHRSEMEIKVLALVRKKNVKTNNMNKLKMDSTEKIKSMKLHI